MVNQVIERETALEQTRPPQISWGAVIAGLAVVIGGSWLLFLLGSAIGLGIADASDSTNVGKGLGIGAIIWMILTSIIVYFLGGMLAGRFAGKPDKTVGMLHGITLWGLGTALMIYLSVLGISNLIQTGQSLLRGTAATATAVGTAAGAAANGGGAAMANSPLVTTIQAQLKQRAAQAIASSTPPGGTPVSPQQAQQAVNQIDSNTLQAVAVQLVQGNTDAAKGILSANTTLSPDQINSVVNGMSNEVKNRVDQATEAAAKYTQGVLWTTFISGALGLIAAIIGGWLGADTIRRLYVENRTVVDRRVAM
jgi:CHASE3 domain sensor protein